ncbi:MULTISPECIES: ATP-binding protein [unclassified Variovorax]|uniref:ATP-binding protein n=1 Tax=unclassified Variovorax TaxID=663243 RepID=UPI003F47F301
MPNPVFHRTQLAEQMVKAIMASAVGSASASGLFLAAPRRTGKSTFVREDLRPALQNAGAIVMYVDLWANKQADPGTVIVAAVRAELSKHDGIVARLAKSAGLEKVTVGGVAFSLDRVGLGKEVSLSGALAALSDETKKPIVLLIDEAQHAITTEAGYDALFALKAARDELNSSAHHGLRIVATGSNRDKLAMLRNSKDQAFFGAPLVSFPVLGLDYVEWFCHGVALPGSLDPTEVMKLFERASFRPEIIGAAADTLRFDFGLHPANVGPAFAKAVDEQIEEADVQTLRVIHALTPLQSAVLRVLASEGENYAPFEASTMQSYRAVLKAIAPDETVTPEVSNVQQALVALQEKSLVWREKRGVYSLEESTTAELLRRHGLLDGH